ncbi:MAG: zf-HC2 domain-containing protein [Polyangiaceae bacterium]|nr:zf-HC2 domain-containing protein [Polyangiaceae bacterium]
MDCERFDRVVLDLLYDELDDLTRAAAKRHIDHCARCRDVHTELRATRSVGILPLIEPPADLEARIIEAERRAHARLPLRQRFGRGVSILAGYAMRPQLTMAALLLLMIGSSLLFLRVKPGERESMSVTERGVPEAEGESVTVLIPTAPAPAPFAAAEEAHGARREKKESDPEALAAAPEAKLADENPSATAAPSEGAAEVSQYDRAMAAYRDSRYKDAIADFDAVATSTDANAASAALFSAQAVRKHSGCSQAAPRFEAVSSRYRGSGVGHEATWQGADCYRALGRLDDARRSYNALLGVAGYGERAQTALASLEIAPEPQAARAAKAAAAPPPAGPTATAKAQPAAKPTATAPPSQ